MVALEVLLDSCWMSLSSINNQSRMTLTSDTTLLLGGSHDALEDLFLGLWNTLTVLLVWHIGWLSEIESEGDPSASIAIFRAIQSTSSANTPRRP